MIVRVAKWYSRRHWLWKILLFAVPVLLIVAVVIVRPKNWGDGEIVSDATAAIDDVTEAGTKAIETIEKENDEIRKRADARSDAVVDAASEPCGQFDSAADLFDKPE